MDGHIAEKTLHPRPPFRVASWKGRGFSHKNQNHQHVQVPEMAVLNIISLFSGLAFPYISRIHTAYIGQDSSILGTWNQVLVGNSEECMARRYLSWKDQLHVEKNMKLHTHTSLGYGQHPVTVREIPYWKKKTYLILVVTGILGGWVVPTHLFLFFRSGQWAAANRAVACYCWSLLVKGPHPVGRFFSRKTCGSSLMDPCGTKEKPK